MTPLLKFCGMMRKEDVAAAAALHPDYIGFILSPGFRRSVTPEDFAEMRPLLNGTGIRAVGVFVDALPDEICAFAPMLDVIQLHGSEDNRFLEALRQETGKPVIKAFCIRSAADLEAAAQSAADTVLLDSGTGTGQAFDRTLIADFARPYLLAGGLTPETVGAAAAALHPFGVDVSSGIETGGRKDAEKMRRFAENLRNACTV